MALLFDGGRGAVGMVVVEKGREKELLRRAAASVCKHYTEIMVRKMIMQVGLFRTSYIDYGMSQRPSRPDSFSPTMQFVLCRGHK